MTKTRKHTVNTAETKNAEIVRSNETKHMDNTAAPDCKVIGDYSVIDNDEHYCGQIIQYGPNYYYDYAAYVCANPYYGTIQFDGSMLPNVMEFIKSSSHLPLVQYLLQNGGVYVDTIFEDESYNNVDEFEVHATGVASDNDDFYLPF